MLCDVVRGVVCRGMLCVVYVVVGGCIICMVFPGILYLILCLILCAVWHVLTSALEFFLSRALQRVFFLCLFFRGFS